jgi:hypothetical protein
LNSHPPKFTSRSGERVQIQLGTADTAHGLRLSFYPEGESEDGNSGLVFDPPQDDAKIEEHKERAIRFVRARPGTYGFKGSVQCSMGRRNDRMTGKLIVEE